MILKKPYAFLIKHFRLIHLVITALLSYMLVKSNAIYKFIKLVISDSANKYDANLFIDYNIYLFMALALILCGIVYWLLKYKDKPRKIYTVTTIGYIIIGIFMLVLYAYLGDLSNNSIDQKTIRLYRDIMTIVLFFQYYIIIFMGIRGLGFDIKRFDFSQDAQELNASAADGEEVEVNVGIDTTNIMRGIRKTNREFGYFFKEYKLYIITILVLVFGIVGYRTYNYLSVKYKVYHENTPIGNMYIITIKDSYYKIDADNNYVIINFDIAKYGKKNRFNTSNMVLMIGKNSYIPDKNICHNFKKLGTCYKKQYINEDTNNYIISYAVDNLNIQDAYLIYNESYDSSYKVKLTMQEY